MNTEELIKKCDNYIVTQGCYLDCEECPFYRPNCKLDTGNKYNCLISYDPDKLYVTSINISEIYTHYINVVRNSIIKLNKKGEY